MRIAKKILLWALIAACGYVFIVPGAIFVIYASFDIVPDISLEHLKKEYPETSVFTSGIKEKPLWWEYLPILSGKSLTAYQRIYLTRSVASHLRTEYPGADALSTLVHESTHVKRWRDRGTFSFAWRYLASPRFRAEEELVAYRAQMEYLISRGVAFSIEDWAESISGPAYFWMLSYDEAIARLEAILKELAP